MPYETGTASDINDLINVKLKNFITTHGWTVNKDTWPTWLAVSKGACYVNLRFDSSTSTTSGSMTQTGSQRPTDAFGVARVDDRFWFHCSSGFTDTAWESQPDSGVNSTSTIEHFGQVNDLTGPFIAYHFYSNTSGEAPFVHMTVETIDDHYQHFTFGEIDQQNLTYSPKASFATGQTWLWWPNTSLYTSRADIYSASGSHNRGYEGSINSNNQWQGQTGGALVGSGVGPGFITTSGTHLFFASPWVTFENEVINLANEPNEFADTGVGRGELYGRYMGRPAISYSGVIPLLPFPVFAGNEYDNNPSATYYLGELPNIRYVSMRNVTPGQEIILGDQVWQCWPQRRKYGYMRIPELEVLPSPAIGNSSWYHGYAIRKTV